MNQITIVEVAGELIVDSRIIAEQLENDHESLLKLLKKHQVKIEAKCGHLRFQIGTVTNSVGAVNEVKFAWLNEKQSTALLNLCRNSDRAVDLKIDLAAAYVDQKRQLEKPEDRALFEELAARVARFNQTPELEQRIQSIESQMFRLQQAPTIENSKQEVKVKNPLLHAGIAHPNPELKEIPTRTKIRKLITDYCHVHNQNYRNVYQHLYEQYKLREGYNAYAQCAKSGGKCKLTQMEVDGEIDKFHQMVTALTA